MHLGKGRIQPNGRGERPLGLFRAAHEVEDAAKDNLGVDDIRIQRDGAAHGVGRLVKLPGGEAGLAEILQDRGRCGIEFGRVFESLNGAVELTAARQPHAEGRLLLGLAHARGRRRRSRDDRRGDALRPEGLDGSRQAAWFRRDGTPREPGREWRRRVSSVRTRHRNRLPLDLTCFRPTPI